MIPEPHPAITEASALAIKTIGLNLWYGRFQALMNVHANIRRSIITALIGPSGCGKTTLLRCFNRMNERYLNVRTTGQVRIYGKNIYDEDVSLIELRKKVGMVFQRPNPLPLSVYDNVALGLRLHYPRGTLSAAQEARAVEQALQEVALLGQIGNPRQVKATSLQLEQQQKLCIARLLPLKPEILLMDEPCSALDAEGTERIEDLLCELRENYTIIIVTHNMAQARRISDESIFMLQGELVEHAPTPTLFLNPRDERTEAYIEGRYG